MSMSLYVYIIACMHTCMYTHYACVCACSCVSIIRCLTAIAFSALFFFFIENNIINVIILHCYYKQLVQSRSIFLENKISTTKCFLVSEILIVRNYDSPKYFQQRKWKPFYIVKY